MKRAKDLRDFDESFLRLEKQANFFDIKVGDRLIWERIRSQIYRDIKQSLDIEGQAHTSSSIESTPEQYIQAVKSLVRSSLTKNPFLTSNHDILVFGHERRKQLEDGLWWDIYFDPIYEELDLDHVHLEKQYLNKHLTPAKTDNLRYHDFIYNIARLWHKIGFKTPRVAEHELEGITYIENQIEAEFGVELELQDSIQYRMELAQLLRRLYRQMLRRINPKIILLVVSYYREEFIEFCKELNIPVVELQHGVIHRNHFGYTFPGNRTKVTFSDYLFVWGDFWSKQAEFPIPDNRILSVGYPYLEQRHNQYTNISSKDQILFISQGTIGERLSKFAMEVNQHSGVTHDVVYKLHPGEYDRWKDEYPWLLEADFEIIDSSEPPLYELFAESDAQVGVGSTAVYEGLAFDLETYVYEKSSVLQPLVDDGSATVVSTADELASALGSRSGSFHHDYYFAPNAMQRMCEMIEWLAEKGTVYNSGFF